MSTTELMAKMDKLLAKAPESRHSYFQLKYFVLGKEPTVQGRLWQCLREIEARRESIRAMTREVEETRDRIRLLELEGEKLAIASDTKKKEPLHTEQEKESLPILRIETDIRCRQLKRQRDGLEEQLTKLAKQKQFAEEEARFFVQAFESLEKIEPVKDYDDLKSQTDYWNSKVGEEINLRMLLQKPLDPEMVKTALALPDDCPVKIQTLQTLQHVEKQMAELKANLQSRRLEAARKEKDATTISTLTPGYKPGDLSAYPVAQDTADLLYRATNNAETALKQSLSYTGKVMIVNDTSLFPTSGLLRIGPRQGPGMSELIVYGSKTRNQFQNLLRGFAGTRQNAWPANSWVANAVAAEHHNAVKDAILKIQANLGVKDNPVAETLNAILQELEITFLAPKPLFRAYPRKGIPPLTVKFQNFSGGQGIRFLWDFGDGSTSIDASPEHIFLTEGNFTVKLNMITSTGAQGIATKAGYIEVSNDNFMPFFYVIPNTGFSVETASQRTLLGIPTSPTSFQYVDQTDANIQQRFWVFDDGQDEAVLNPNNHTTTHVYQSPNTEPGYQPSLLMIFGNQKQKRAFLSDRIIVL